MIPAEDFIERLAQASERFGQQAGVGGMETAGLIVSYLADHPDWLGAFMKEGVHGLPSDFGQHGCLTWQAMNGNIVSPEYARHARIIKGLKAPCKETGDAK